MINGLLAACEVSRIRFGQFCSECPISNLRQTSSASGFGLLMHWSLM